MISDQAMMTLLESHYEGTAHSDYNGFLQFVDQLGFSEEKIEEVKMRFPKPGCTPPTPLQPKNETSEDFTQGFATDPPDRGPLSEFDDHGWIDEFGADKFRKNEFYNDVKKRTGIKDKEVLRDIQENTLHILGRCNDPRNWGENRRGLVYGMVQSGKPQVWLI